MKLRNLPRLFVYGRGVTRGTEVAVRARAAIQSEGITPRAESEALCGSRRSGSFTLPLKGGRVSHGISSEGQ